MKTDRRYHTYVLILLVGTLAVAVHGFTGTLREPAATVQSEPTPTETVDPLLITPWTPAWTPDPRRASYPAPASDPVEAPPMAAWAQAASVREIVQGYEHSFQNINREGLDPATIVFTKTYRFDDPALLSYIGRTSREIPEGDTRPFILMMVNGGHPSMSRGPGGTSMTIREHAWVIFHQGIGGVLAGRCDDLQACIAQFP